MEDNVSLTPTPPDEAARRDFLKKVGKLSLLSLLTASIPQRVLLGAPVLDNECGQANTTHGGFKPDLLCGPIRENGQIVGVRVDGDCGLARPPREGPSSPSGYWEDQDCGYVKQPEGEIQSDNDCGMARTGKTDPYAFADNDCGIMKNGFILGDGDCGKVKGLSESQPTPDSDCGKQKAAGVNWTDQTNGQSFGCRTNGTDNVPS